MGHAPLPRAAFAHGLLAMLVVLTATGCAGVGAKTLLPPAPSISAVPTDPEVTATGLPDGVDVEVTEATPSEASGDNISFVSPIYTVTPFGPLDQAATVSLRLDNALPADTPVLVATRTDEKDAWAYSRARISEDQRHVDFRTSSLDQVAVLAIERDGALSSLRADVRTALFPRPTGPSGKVTAPTCLQPEEARTAGYAARSTKHKTLFWCFGLEKQKRVVTITNRRAVPVEVAHVGMGVVTAPQALPASSIWSSVLGDSRTILPPGGTATYDAELEPEAKVTLVASSTRQAQALRVLEATSSALVKRLEDFDAGPVKAAPTLTRFLKAPRCAKALGVGPAAVAENCFSKAQLRRSFGSRSLLVEPLMSGPYSAAFFERLGKRLSTEATAQRERVSVRRVVPDFAGLVGLWSGTARSLSVTADGVVTETVQDGGALVIKLTYQLADPMTQDATTTADSTLTAVQVGKRALLNGPLPRVGATGRITMRKGVITPPYLRTTYCDSSAAKKKTCGA